MSYNAVDNEDLRDYLLSKGVDEILAELSEEEKTFSELEEVVGISTATLSKRLQKGAALGILKEEIQYQQKLDGDVDKTKKYMISNSFSDFSEMIDESDLLRFLRKKRTYDERANESYNELVEKNFAHPDQP